jgi:transcriptional regulator with XRE-family HTH domain
MDGLADLRRGKGFSQRALAKAAGVSPSTIFELERGGHSAPHPSTAKKLADALGVEVVEVLEALVPPKGEAPHSSAPDKEDEQRRTIYDSLQALAMRKIADYDREVAASDSPHFRDATAATLWLDGVQRDAAQWADWVMEEAATLAAPQGESSLREHILNALKVSGPLLQFDRVIRKGRKRLENAVGQTDVLTQKRLEKSTQRFEEIRETLSA